MAWCPYFSAGAGVPASAQYEQNVSIGIRKAEGYHCVPLCARDCCLNLGVGDGRSQSLASGRDMIAGEPLEFIFLNVLVFKDS